MKGDDILASDDFYAQLMMEEQYRRDCLTCEYVAGKYYNNDGIEVNETQYLAACFPACKCENNKCYNKSHEEVTEDEYRKDCFSCKKDGDKKGEKLWLIDL